MSKVAILCSFHGLVVKCNSFLIYFGCLGLCMICENEGENKNIAKYNKNFFMRTEYFNSITKLFKFYSLFLQAIQSSDRHRL